jgi:hypothetical protein
MGGGESGWVREHCVSLKFIHDSALAEWTNRATLIMPYQGCLGVNNPLETGSWFKALNGCSFYATGVAAKRLLPFCVSKGKFRINLD